MAAEHHDLIVRAPEGATTIRKLLLVATIALLPATASAGSTIFTDGTFNLAGYSISPQFLTGTGTTLSTAQCPNCGNPSGQGLQLIGTFPTDPVPAGSIDTAAEVLINNAFLYTPSTQGAITSLSASVDKNLLINIALTGAGNTFRPTILQDGVYYVASLPGPSLTTGPGGGSTGYNNIASGLTAADFLSYDISTDTFGTAHPDFAGDPMRFGLTQIFGVGITETIEADYDNLSFAINAPEPAALAIFCVGLLGLVAARRRIV